MKGGHSSLEADISGSSLYLIVKYGSKDTPKIMISLTQIMKYAVI